MDSPLLGGMGYTDTVEFTDFMLWKAIGIVVLAFLYGIWRGATGRSGQERSKHRE